VTLYLIISGEFLDTRITPHVTKRDALSTAVRSHASVDINIALFDILGRVGMHALWLGWIAQKMDDPAQSLIRENISNYVQVGFSMIESNPVLYLPIKDEQATSVALFLVAKLQTDCFHGQLSGWIAKTIDRYHFTLLTRGRFPTSYSDYEDIREHPRDNSSEYLEEATVGSTLLPLLVLWAGAMRLDQVVNTATKIVKNYLNHCTMQLWIPSSDSEEHLYLNSNSHGRAVCNLPISGNYIELFEAVSEACDEDEGITQLSAMKAGFWPLVLLACKHWRLPIPPQFYLDALKPETPSSE
jgi:hypothetical protein